MTRILVLFIILSFQSAFAQELEWDVLCDGLPLKDTPLLRVGLTPYGFENQIEKVLTTQISVVEETVEAIDLRDRAIGGKKEPCPERRDRPGMEKKHLCMYVPKILLGEEVALRDIMNELKSSVGLRMNFDHVQIPVFDVENPVVKCDFGSEEAICEVEIDIPAFEINSQFELVDPRNKRVVLSTINPLELKVKARDELMPKLRLKARLTGNDRANSAISIVKDSITFSIPDGIATSKVNTLEDDLIPELMKQLEAELDPNLSEEDKATAMLKFMETDRGNKIIEELSSKHGMIALIGSFLKDINLIENYKEILIEHIDEPLSIVLSKIIEKALPFENNHEFEIPVPPVQDQVDGVRYFERFKEILEYLEAMEKKYKAMAPKGYRYTREIRKPHYRELRKIERFVENIAGTQLKEIGAELLILSVRLENHQRVLGKINVLNKSLRKRLARIAALAEATGNKVHDNSLPTYRKSLLHVDHVGRVNEGGIELLVTGCHLGGLMPDVPEDWYLSEPNKPLLEGNDFSFEVPISLVNQHLKLLHSNSFFNYCEVKGGKSCAETSGTVKTSIKVKASPQIKLHKGKYILEMPDVEATKYTILPNFMDRLFLRGSSRIRVCMDNLTMDVATGKIVPKGCIEANANVEKNFKAEHFLSLVTVGSAIAVFGGRFTFTGLQEAILDSMEDGELARSLSDILLRNGDYMVRELRAEGDRLSLFGKVESRSEKQ